MKRCPKCNCENALGNMYCERCGAALPGSDASLLDDPTYVSSYETYPSSSTQQVQPYSDELIPLSPPPPPPSLQYIPSLNVAPDYRYGYEAISPGEPRKRRIGATILGSIFYVLGLFCFAFGSAGFLLYGISSAIIGTVFVSILIIGLIIFILLLVFRKHLHLKSGVRSLIIVSLTGLATIALFVCAAAIPAYKSYPYYGVIFIIYGFLTAVVAFW